MMTLFDAFKTISVALREELVVKADEQKVIDSYVPKQQLAHNQQNGPKRRATPFVPSLSLETCS